MSHCPVLVGMHDSYFSHLIFHNMCAYRGACPAFINTVGKRNLLRNVECARLRPRRCGFRDRVRGQRPLRPTPAYP